MQLINYLDQQVARWRPRGHLAAKGCPGIVVEFNNIEHSCYNPVWFLTGKQVATDPGINVM